jgi:hypothetical protein
MMAMGQLGTVRISHAGQYEQSWLKGRRKLNMRPKNEPNYVSGLLGDGILLTCFGLT